MLVKNKRFDIRCSILIIKLLIFIIQKHGSFHQSLNTHSLASVQQIIVIYNYNTALSLTV